MTKPIPRTGPGHAKDAPRASRGKDAPVSIILGPV